MSTPSWAKSVERARRAMFKDLESRMEVAEASLEQVTFGNKDSTNKDLGRFAADVGIDLQTLSRYRQIHTWLEWDAERRTTSSVTYATVRTAKDTGYWAGGYDFLSHVEQNVPPVYEREGFEPYVFTSWTEDAVLVAAGREPRQIKLVEIKVERGEKVTEDSFRAAEAADHFTAGAETASEIEDTVESRKATQAAREAEGQVENHHMENVVRDIEDGSRDPDDDFFDMAQKAISRSNLPSVIAFTAKHLRELLAEVPEWRAKHGHLRVSQDAALQDDLLAATLDEEQGLVDHAFDIAKTASVVDEIENWLVDK